ncbi:MAG: glycosyltransferase family 4 protein [Pseudomonadota bacterium]
MTVNAPNTLGKKVWSLNYHEVLSDPRVMKQAEALNEAGYDVSVYCDQPRGMASRETVEGIRICRFNWRNFEVLSDRSARDFSFLGDSYKPFENHFEELVKCSLELRRLRESNADLGKLLTRPEYFKSYYRDMPASERKLRHRSYRRNKLKRRFAAMVSRKHKRVADVIREMERHYLKARRVFVEMHQGRALVFAANIAKEEMRDRPDFIHAHDIYTLPAGVMLACRFGARLIYDAHELETARATNMGPNGQEVIEQFEARCFDHTDAIVTVSDSIAALYGARFPKRPPTVVMNAPLIAMTPAEARSQGIDIRSRVGLAEDVPLFVYTGGVQREHRGLDKVVAALGRLPECHLVTLGPRHHDNDNWLREHASAADMADRLHMFESVPSSMVVPVISSATAAIVPIQGVSLSYQLAMPNKLFEAAAAKLPILVSDLPDMRRFVEELGNGIVMDHTSPEGIETAIRQFLSDPSACRVGTSAQDVFDTKYDWPVQVKKLLALYEELGCS